MNERDPKRRQIAMNIFIFLYQNDPGEECLAFVCAGTQVATASRSHAAHRCVCLACYTTLCWDCCAPLFYHATLHPVGLLPYTQSFDTDGLSFYSVLSLQFTASH